MIYMGLIKGITVTLYEKQEDGLDALGAPTYIETPVEVRNVLVAPVSSEGQATELELTGKRAVYQLGIPKDDNHIWENRVVEFFGRQWRTIGIVTQGQEELMPLAWNKNIKVEAYE